MFKILSVPFADDHNAVADHKEMFGLLTHDGIEGIVMPNFTQAAQHLHQNDIRPDMVVFDLSQIDGYSIARSVLSKVDFTSVPVVVIAGGATPAAVRELVADQCGDNFQFLGMISKFDEQQSITSDSPFCAQIKAFAAKIQSGIQVASIPGQISIVKQKHRKILSGIDGVNGMVFGDLRSFANHIKAGYKPHLLIVDFGWVEALGLAFGPVKNLDLERVPVIAIASGHARKNLIAMGRRFNIIHVSSLEQQYDSDMNGPSLRDVVRAATAQIGANPSTLLTRENFVVSVPVTKVPAGTRIVHPPLELRIKKP